MWELRWKEGRTEGEDDIPSALPGVPRPYLVPDLLTAPQGTSHVGIDCCHAHQEVNIPRMSQGLQ